MVAELERGFCTLAGTTHALAVNSGTTALVLALKALGVGPGDEVITSPFTFAATLNAILEVGALARFVDIDDSFCIDASQLVSNVTSRTSAVMPVHLYGQAADMSGILSARADRPIPIVEDAAQALGASVDGRRVGSFGLGCFSLYATKNLTAGEGGVVTTDDDELAERMRILRNQGMRERYRYEMVGHNYRLTDLQAAVAVPQLATLDKQTAVRLANAEQLTAGLTGIPGLVLPRTATGRSHVWHQYTVRVTDAAPIDRERLAAGLAAKGIGSGMYYPAGRLRLSVLLAASRRRCGRGTERSAGGPGGAVLPVHPHLRGR